jgi:hypothetical protein
VIDTPFTDSSLQFWAANTTTVHILLHNRHRKRSFIGSDSDPNVPDGPVDFSVEIAEERTVIVENAASLVQIVDDLDPQRTYKIRMAYIGHNRIPSALHLEGIWLGEGASVATRSDKTDNRTRGRDSSIKTADQDPPVPDMRGSYKPVIEIVTSEWTASAIGPRGAKAFHQQKQELWYNRMGSLLPAEISLIDVDQTLLVTQHATKSDHGKSKHGLRDVYFRWGLGAYSKDTIQHWSVESHTPSALILQFGFADFAHFLNGTSSANKHAMTAFTNSFVAAYVDFVKAIRFNIHSSDPSAPDQDEDASYIYNSAPSTLPIFLLAPFSAHRRLVTRRLTLHKFISDALAQVALTLRAQGDTSTVWIDTSGWLHPLEDFEHRQDENASTVPSMLTKEANAKVAELLAQHFCPYVTPATASSASATALKGCAFDAHDSYVGNVYLPQDVALSRVMLERKIDLIKSQVGFTDPGIR